MTTLRLIALAALLTILASLPGCYYYVRATPEIIISSEPFTAPTPRAP